VIRRGEIRWFRFTAPDKKRPVLVLGREDPAEPTAFDQGISRFTLLILVFMAVMVPLVVLINGLTRGNWTEAFFFSVAVGLTCHRATLYASDVVSKRPYVHSPDGSTQFTSPWAPVRIPSTLR
jgi:magnesium-transporting ATPase (P-type)